MMSNGEKALSLGVRNETRQRIPLAAVRRSARRAGALLRLPPRTFVHLSLVTDARMRRLNRRTRGVNRSTDVLSFPLHNRRALQRVPRDPDGVLRLGDVVIGVGVARRQAAAQGVTLSRELARLFAHGLLHLRGYDHRRRRGARQMDRLTQLLIR